MAEKKKQSAPTSYLQNAVKDWLVRDRQEIVQQDAKPDFGTWFLEVKYDSSDITASGEHVFVSIIGDESRGRVRMVCASTPSDRSVPILEAKGQELDDHILQWKTDALNVDVQLSIINVIDGDDHEFRIILNSIVYLNQGLDRTEFMKQMARIALCNQLTNSKLDHYAAKHTESQS